MAHTFGTSIGLLLARLPVGVTFLVAGINKVRGGVGAFVESASGAIPGFLPSSVGHAYLYALPFAEMLVGALLTVALATRPVALVASLMLVSFMIAVTGAIGQGPSLHFNVAYLGVTLCLVFAGPGVFSADYLLRGKRKSSPQKQ